MRRMPGPSPSRTTSGPRSADSQRMRVLDRQNTRESVTVMREIPSPPAVLGVMCLLAAGFLQSIAGTSRDPELVWAAVYALGGLGLIGVVAAGVAAGIRFSRD